MCSVRSTLTIDDKYNDTKKIFLLKTNKYYEILQYFFHTTSTLLRNGSISHFLYSSSLHCLHLHCGVIKETWGQPYCFRGVNKVCGVISKNHFHMIKMILLNIFVVSISFLCGVHCVVELHKNTSYLCEFQGQNEKLASF